MFDELSEEYKIGELGHGILESDVIYEDCFGVCYEGSFVSGRVIDITRTTLEKTTFHVKGRRLLDHGPSDIIEPIMGAEYNTASDIYENITLSENTLYPTINEYVKIKSSYYTINNIRHWTNEITSILTPPLYKYINSEYSYDIKARNNQYYISSQQDRPPFKGNLPLESGKIYTVNGQLNVSKTYNHCICHFPLMHSYNDVMNKCAIDMTRENGTKPNRQAFLTPSGLMFNTWNQSESSIYLNSLPELNEFTLEFYHYIPNERTLANIGARRPLYISFVEGAPILIGYDGKGKDINQYKQLPTKRWFHHAFVRKFGLHYVYEFVDGELYDVLYCPDIIPNSIKFSVIPALYTDNGGYSSGGGSHVNLDHGDFVTHLKIWDIAKYTESFIVNKSFKDDFQKIRLWESPKLIEVKIKNSDNKIDKYYYAPLSLNDIAYNTVWVKVLKSDHINLTVDYNERIEYILDEGWHIFNYINSPIYFSEDYSCVNPWDCVDWYDRNRELVSIEMKLISHPEIISYPEI